MKCLNLLALGLAAFSTMAVAADGDDLRLVPFPKEVRLLTGEFSLGRPLVLETPDAQVEVFARRLKEELQRAGLKAAQTRTSGSPGLAFRLTTGNTPGELPSLPREPHPEFYSLEVRADEVVCTAAQPAGLVHGLQTLCQLIRANRHGDALPCLTIRDWPSLRWRCFQDDMTRGPSSTLDTLKFEASLGSYLKLNLMTFYMEYQYAFKKHPQIGPPNGSLTAEELSALVAYAKPLHLDILGNQQSFGHFSQILKHSEFTVLRETPDVLTPVREETYRLLDDLYSEVCPLLPFPWFNVCCDETYGLGTGPSRELASQTGVGGVYVRHLRRVHDLLKERHGKRMMMWGDIILQHPDKLEEIPKDTIMLTWGYDARPNFEDQIVPFAKSGYEFFVCPGASDWSRILPDFGVAVTNIQNFVRDGVKHGALGMINTDWEDDGEALKAVKWHADAWAAECAWNASATPIESFNHRVGAVLFGEAGDHFGQVVALLARTHRLPAMKAMVNSRFWEDDFVPQAKPAVIQTTASNLLAVVRPALEHFEACQQEVRCNAQVIETLLFGARRMELIAQRMLDGLEASQLYEQAYESAAGADALASVEQLIRKHRDAHEALGRKFASLWVAESKPYALDWTMRRYTNVAAQYDTLLRKVADARSEVRAGRRLPAPEEVGLAMPKPISRRVQPQPRDTPLAPESPWAELTATHRLGLVVNARAADRFHLPVEIELSLPPALAAQPVRAFAQNKRGMPGELLAQLDTLSQPGKSRLVLILDQPLLKNEQVSVHVYLGLPQPPRLLPGAVSTHPGANGTHWIENDRIRALLGGEGAHVYRWEVKSAANRDLTMPGESGWAGFSDIGSQRGAAYRLNCTARGPAMVEIQCREPNGHEKTIRFYSGASWMEALLDEPTPLYWDFDDPRNFAADGPTPGTWLFSNGQSGLVGRAADGVPAQVKAPDTYWGIKFNQEKVALGLITPEIATFHHVAPGSAAGGVGIESSPAAQHFVTFAGRLETSPAETMTRLRSTLDLKQPVSIWLYSLQAR